MLADLILVHSMEAKIHLSGTVLQIKLAEPNINTSECHELIRRLPLGTSSKHFLHYRGVYTVKSLKHWERG
jgi:hypothetical protein